MTSVMSVTSVTSVTLRAHLVVADEAQLARGMHRAEPLVDPAETRRVARPARGLVVAAAVDDDDWLAVLLEEEREDGRCSRGT